jgi:hypothetical protein
MICGFQGSMARILGLYHSSLNKTKQSIFQEGFKPLQEKRFGGCANCLAGAAPGMLMLPGFGA